MHTVYTNIPAPLVCLQLVALLFSWINPGQNWVVPLVSSFTVLHVHVSLHYLFA